MPVRYGDDAVTRAYLGATELDALYIGSDRVYQPGTLNAGVTRQGNRNIAIAAVVSDPDGIRSVDAATITADSDGRVQSIGFARRDANSFTHSDTRRNVWRAGTMSVTYTDGNGVQSTLTDSWSV